MPKGKWKPLTKPQEDKIKREYLTKPTKPLADEIGITSARIKRFLKKNGLEIPQKIIDERKNIGRMKKGNTPFNKGKKQASYMSEDAILRTSKTRFKKGDLPKNTDKRGNGAISIRGKNGSNPYKYIRVALGEWHLLHRVVWENKYGKIPDKMVVVFKDGDYKNVVIENLELISMEENMLRNSKMNYHSELTKSMALVSKINKKVKQFNNTKNGTK